MGNSIYTEAELLQVLGLISGQTYDLSGLRQLSNRITEHYRQSGYPFARAYLPPQSLEGGALRIEVVEGRYGEVKTLGDGRLASGALAFLAPLKPGDVIGSSVLERAVLILGDQPGLQIAPVIRPGQEVGTADLDVRVEAAPRLAVELALNNYGDYYTGQGQAHLNLRADSALRLGDQISLYSLVTDERMWFGSLGYALPLGASGLRAQVGYQHTYYRLSKAFASLDSTGTAEIFSAGLSYPLLRTHAANLTLRAIYQHKVLDDRQGSIGAESHKSSDTLPLTLNFDLADNFAGGGVTYGSVGWTPGRLNLDAALSAIDSQTAQTAGGFSHVNIDLVTVRPVIETGSVYGRLSGQWASKNLDSSEGFGLGGPYGVRAYPVGEAFGDQGWLGQIELRYAHGALNPYLFYDFGQVKINVDPWSPGVNNRTLSGYGVGLRYQAGALSMEASLAWRNQGGPPHQDTRDPRPRGWVTGSYRF